MNARSRNDQEKFERREALLNAAQNVFFKKGFQHTSMDDIANTAGFSRSLLYVYFKDKKDIYRSLRIRSVEALRDRMIAYVDNNVTGLEQVKQIGEAFYSFYQHDKEHFDCLSVDISLNNQTASLKRETHEDAESLCVEQQTMGVMIKALETGIRDGSINPERVPNPLQTAMYLRGSLHGVVMLQDDDGSALLDKAGIDKHQLVMFAIEQMTNMLRA